ncbi:hypothetical protein GCM10007036_25730 [Alsobacter metallidurans]|uniref:O-antigen ligase-related domain-containing protein n=1 Tax=Alsobacter metallidurans TaxID=340221 RepID=A0A917I784_9HYPH|nr:O-antigen ligase family protein [Alsobacter metallidurans]GGH21447.1 hypothetical protein GCM10007036_25730 [Alsobacter metallidurans]
MTFAPAHSGIAPAPFAYTARRGPPVAAVQNGILRLLVLCGAIVFIEPSPFEVVFTLAGLVMLLTGFRLPRESIPLIVLLTLFNLGGAISLTEVTEDQKAVIFTAVSVYMLAVTLFFVIIMMDRTHERVALIQRAQILAAVIAAIAGTLGYFNVAGLSSLFTAFSGTRASGMFKDPNVFGPFIAVGATFLFHGVVSGRTRHVTLSVLTLVFLSFAVLISFSRGAWGVMGLSLAMVVGLNLLTSRSWAQRRRIAWVTSLFLLCGLVAGAAVLTNRSMANMLEERAVLLQSYDSGETGRFGNQKRSIPLLLDLPNGFGPLQFDKRFGENPHNVFIFAFSSYGWLGGISYLSFVIITCVIGWRMAFQRTPFQHDAIALWCCLFPQIAQGFQIDTDHWRHFWMLSGMVWGLAIMASRWKAANAPAQPHASVSNSRA